MDRENGFWVTTLSNGIYYFLLSMYSSYTASEEISSMVNVLTAEEDTVYIGVRDGSITKIVDHKITGEKAYLSNYSGLIYSLKKFKKTNYSLVIQANILHYQ